MKLKLKHRIFNKLPLVFSFVMFGLLSCGDEYWLDNVDCSQCYVPKPEYGPVTVNVTINDENTSVPVKIFKGKYQEKYLYDYSSAVYVDTLDSEILEVDLKVDEYYSVAAEYVKNGKKVIAVNGNKLKIYKVSDNCDEVCWIFKGGVINATLKD